MFVKRPLKLRIPPCGVLAAESMHDVRFEMVPESHAFHEVYYVFKGQPLYFEGKTESPEILPEGTCYPISAGISHRIEDQSQATVLLLCFSEAFINTAPYRRALWERLAGRERGALYPNALARARLEASLRLIMAEQETLRSGAEALIEGEGLKALVALSRLVEEPQSLNAEQRVSHLASLLELHYSEPWDLDVAAERAQLSRRRFSALFHEVTGTTFLKRLSEIRLAHAAKMLQQGSSSIAGAAFATGFQDVSHFYRVFRKRYGLPPGEWLRKSGRD